MNTAVLDTDRFLTLLRDETGLAVDADDLDTDFDELPGWDSVMLLKLLTAVEQATGGPAPMLEVLEARNLRAVHTAIVR
ncbi:phosphopantetheine-binding protein [Streptomyces alkaliterrae]|uniref:Acyl carrier protein n=1 Tax=Streptomyces alkaliterrae TaxID=2213162 RepID=A0A5P0YUC0_9ACTN|nr:phosphopantetheine-binding protein [Streptomyces alkaliterrae]MBB1256108.1 acyl carrier protein [Streptomyces alkaliterrae]MBB1259114.1 acyl carrier protein [Streptomyces alkaliterrae]MQS03878.1 acyl carrier protein [Streptomyces alkaliterrae]